MRLLKKYIYTHMYMICNTNKSHTIIILTVCFARLVHNWIYRLRGIETRCFEIETFSGINYIH